MVKIDLHVHSNHSDGLNSIEEVIKEAISKDLDGIALCDHDTLEGVKEAQKIAKGYTFIIIPGIEISSKEGHILGLGITKKIRKGMSAKKTIEHIHKQKGLAIAPHPYGKYIHRSSVGDLIKELDFDAIEVFNSRNINENNKALEIANELNAVQVAGSDAHTLKTIGKAYTIANCEPNANAFLEKIKEGNVLWIGNKNPLRNEVYRKLKSFYLSITNKYSL